MAIPKTMSHRRASPPTAGKQSRRKVGQRATERYLPRGFSRIQRVDGVRTVTVSGDLDTRLNNAREIINHTQREFLPLLYERYPGVTAGIEGQSKQSAKTGISMLRSFAIGLVGVFVLLSFQFRSYLQPLVVMAVIPLALIGVIWDSINDPLVGMLSDRVSTKWGRRRPFLLICLSYSIWT